MRMRKIPPESPVFSRIGTFGTHNCCLPTESATGFRNVAALRMAEPPKLLIRSMTRRWGSCTKGRTVTLNVDLVKVPLLYIDYVIMHELCHVKIHNHTLRFIDC